MFLINIRELTLENFIGDQNIPRYFILSHTWSDDEVTYQDVRDTPKERLDHRKGWQKITGFCEMLLTPGKWPNSQLDLRGIEYAWVDTCCINKDSSAELSEAINSMYQWYKNAAACIVYLDDVTETVMDCGQVRSSRWFTRGWTLQELLAPTVVTFYNKEWTRIGTLREDATCISEITGINWKFLYFKYLNIPDEIESASVAQKMSWAAKRQTTRSEDMAYCLMGLFDVNMPLLYGEGGEKAFCRLQEEILKDSQMRARLRTTNEDVGQPFQPGSGSCEDDLK
ncbi:HET-domain-containing protein [Sarocladium strictum]